MVICKICGEKLDNSTNLEFIICPVCNVEWRIIRSDFSDELKLHLIVACGNCGKRMETEDNAAFVTCFNCNSQWDLVYFSSKTANFNTICRICNNSLSAIEEKDHIITCSHCGIKWFIDRPHKEEFNLILFLKCGNCFKEILFKENFQFNKCYHCEEKIDDLYTVICTVCGKNLYAKDFKFLKVICSQCKREFELKRMDTGKVFIKEKLNF